jgi:tryptophanyl-tRNA synthetase
LTDKAEVTPWEVSGELKETDYSRIADQFGARLIDQKILSEIKEIAGEIHPFLHYGIFFAHRDLDIVLQNYRKGEPFYLYTGRGPSGNMHLGHLLPFMFTKWLQEKFDVDLLIQITDDEKYLFRDIPENEIKSITRNNILDILSLGFNPEKTHIIVDSEQAGILYNQAVRVSRHITASTAKAVFGFTDSDSIGKYFFTSMQAVPAFLLSALSGKNIRCLIPYAIDQDPHFKVARDVIPKLGYEKPSSIISKFIPSLKGGGKMSSSDTNSGIYLDDSPKVVRKKLMKYAFSGGRETAEEQRKYGANPDIDFAFNIYRMLEHDQKKVGDIYSGYKNGEILSGEMKQLAADTISAFLETLKPVREQAERNFSEYMFNPDDFRDRY